MNITLIGMPAAGKSVIGVLLAKSTGLNFVDTDLVIQKQEKKLLKEIIAQDGLEIFLSIENQVNASICEEDAIIAPGGSVIYGKEAMRHLKEISMIIYLKVSYEEVKSRLGDLKDRGVALKDGMTLKELYEERAPLYEQWADLIVDEQGKTPGMLVAEIREKLAI